MRTKRREPEPELPGAAVFTLALVGSSITIAASGWPDGLAGTRLLRSALVTCLGQVDGDIDRLLAGMAEPAEPGAEGGE